MENWILENEYFRLQLETSGKLKLQVRNNPRIWMSENPFRFTYGDFYSFNLAGHCRMRVQTTGNQMQIDFSRMDWLSRFPGHFYRKPDPGPDLKFHFEIELKQDQILFTTGKIQGMDAEDCTLQFPYQLLSWDCSEHLNAVIPRGYGQLVDFPRENEFFDCCWGYFGVPIHGVLRKDGGFGVRILTPCDHRNRLSVGTLNPNRASLDTEYRFNRRFANYPRRTVWKYFPEGSDFVTLAKWFRSEKIREKALVTLQEKIQKNPEVEKLIGAVIWKHSVYSQKKMPAGVQKNYSLYALNPVVSEVEGKPDGWNAYELFDRAREMGFDRVCVYNTGWNHCGYDSGYPTRFPVNAERGTEQDFQAAAEYARSLSPDYIYSVHDNYCDVYDNADEPLDHSVRINRNQVPAQGGIWRGGRAKLQCTAAALKYARRDIPRIARMLGRGSIYIDVLGSAALSECYSAEHPASRRDDLKNRRKLMMLIKKQFGSLASEALPCDLTADLVDLGAYLSSALESEFPHHIRKAIAIPLWQLVYHDSVLCFTNAYDLNSTRNYHALCALFCLLPGNLDQPSLRLSRELRNAYAAEMTDFRFLSPPAEPYRYVARSRFADGTEVIANMTDQTYSAGKLTVKPHSFVIRKFQTETHKNNIRSQKESVCK